MPPPSAAPAGATAVWPRIEVRGNATITYHTPSYRKIEGADPSEWFPWPDGWGSPERHEQGGEPPFDADGELDTEFAAIVG